MIAATPTAPVGVGVALSIGAGVSHFALGPEHVEELRHEDGHDHAVGAMVMNVEAAEPR